MREWFQNEGGLRKIIKKRMKWKETAACSHNLSVFLSVIIFSIYRLAIHSARTHVIHKSNGLFKWNNTIIAVIQYCCIILSFKIPFTISFIEWKTILQLYMLGITYMMLNTLLRRLALNSVVFHSCVKCIQSNIAKYLPHHELRDSQLIESLICS